MASDYQHISHGFEPVFDGRSRALVLGSFPSVLSRENAFYYGNPQNRFWRVIAACVGEPTPPNEGEPLLGDRCAALPGGEPLPGEVFRLTLTGEGPCTVTLKNATEQFQFGINAGNEAFIDRTKAGARDFSEDFASDWYARISAPRFYTPYTTMTVEGCATATIAPLKEG